MATGNLTAFLLYFSLLLGGAAALSGPESGCVARSYGYDSVVCVCTEARCDVPPGEPAGGLGAGQLLRVVSTRAGLRLDASVAELATASQSGGVDDNADATAELRVSGVASGRQSILGFGGALTDSAGLNIDSLSPAPRRLLLEQLFGRNGARYSVVRVPVAGTDFSTHNYTYDDGAVDPELENFALTREDADWKIPILNEIFSLVGSSLVLFASAWSAPDWMVVWDNDGLNHLNPEYDQVWADYYVRFLDEYAMHGLMFWGMTTQNEPSDGYLVNYGINRLGWSPERSRDWIRDHLGPTLVKSGYGDLKIMIHDDHRQLLPEWPQRTLNDSDTNSYVSGIAVHWYKDMQTSPELLTQTHDLFPDKFLLYTEACDGTFMSGGPTVQLGNWTRAENYAEDIIEAINNWSVGWVDWNLALDTDGGPSYAGNEVDTGIIVNATAGEFLKQPTLYALTHFSRYVPRGSRQLPVAHSAAPHDGALFASAFATPEGRYVLVLLNRASEEQKIAIALDDLQDKIYKDTLPEHSITTLVIRAE